MNNLKSHNSKTEVEKCTLNTEKRYSFNLAQKSLLDGIIMSEILGKPKARKGLVPNNVYKSTNSR